MSFSLPDIAGTIGVALIVLTYILLQTERVRSEQLAYSVINGLGAALILVSLWFDPNLPSVVVESFWLVISIYGIVRYFGRKK
jgi:hypothetical protein